MSIFRYPSIRFFALECTAINGQNALKEFIEFLQNRTIFQASPEAGR